MLKKKRNYLTIRQKLELIQKIKDGVSTEVLVQEYGICKWSIWSIAKSESKLKALSTQLGVDSSWRKRNAPSVETYRGVTLEQAIYNWYKQQVNNGTKPTNEVVCSVARQIAKFYNKDGFKASQPWLTRFKTRFNIPPERKRGRRSNDASKDKTEATTIPEESSDVLSVEARGSDMSESSWAWEGDQNHSLGNLTTGRAIVKSEKPIVIDLSDSENHDMPASFEELQFDCPQQLNSEEECENTCAEDQNNSADSIATPRAIIESEHEEPKVIDISDSEDKIQSTPTTIIERRVSQRANYPQHLNAEEAFNALDTAIKWAELQQEINIEQLMCLRTLQSIAAKQALAHRRKQN